MENEYLERARERVEKELSEFGGDKYESVMKDAVAETLLELCELNAEFSQAVVQGGDFAGCMAEVKKAVKKGALSDIDAYCAAAAYYFPGCKVRMRLEINMSGDVDEDAYGAPQSSGTIIDLASFL